MPSVFAYVEHIIKEYPGDSLSEIFAEGLYLKLYPLADMTAVVWKGP